MDEFYISTERGTVISIHEEKCEVVETENNIHIHIDIPKNIILNAGDIVEWEEKYTEFLNTEDQIEGKSEYTNLRIITDQISDVEKKEIYYYSGEALLSSLIKDGITSGSVPEKWVLNTSKECKNKDLKSIASQVYEVDGFGWDSTLKGTSPFHWNITTERDSIMDQLLIRCDSTLWSIVVYAGKEDSYSLDLTSNGVEELRQLDKNFTLKNIWDFNSYEEALEKYVCVLKEYDKETETSKNFTNSHYRFFKGEDVVEVILAYNVSEYMKMDLDEKTANLFLSKLG